MDRRLNRGTGFTRRDAIRLVGVATGLGAVATLEGYDDLFAWLQRGGAAAPVRFPRGAIIRTLLKDIPPEALGSGATLFHEHLSINLASLGGGGARGGQPGGQAAGTPPTSPQAPPAARGGGRGGPPLPPATDDLELMVQLVQKAGTEGVSCIVDGGHPDMGRKLDDLKKIAMRTNVHIVASGGYYMQRSYPPDVAAKSEDQLADDLARDARDGRLGAFGEIGEDPNGSELTLNERKVFRAIGKAQAKTGLPVFTHNSYGTGPNVPRDIGLQQLDLLESAGANPAHVVIGHTCCLDDPDVTIIKEVAKRGAFVGFDRVTTVQNIMPDEKKVAMVLKFLEAGHADKLLLAADFTGQRTMEAGPGYGRTLTVFVPLLRKAGVSDDTIHTILYDNPRRLLAFVPKKA
jgi:phosphotriesterase-related protein